MRYLAIDLGDKRTGLATGDSVTRLVMPLDVLEVPVTADGGGALMAALAKAVAEQLGPPTSPGVIVIGLPLNMDDSEGPKAKAARELGARLGERVGREVVYQDERLTSVEADWSMARSGLTRGQKKAKRDALAAAAILRDYFATLPPSAGSGW